MKKLKNKKKKRYKFCRSILNSFTDYMLSLGTLLATAYILFKWVITVKDKPLAITAVIFFFIIFLAVYLNIHIRLWEKWRRAIKKHKKYYPSFWMMLIYILPFLAFSAIIALNFINIATHDIPTS